MKLATYNMMFGMDGQTSLRMLFNNFLFHYTKSPRLVKRASRHVQDTLDIILREQPDILCLNEVLRSIQGDVVEEGLRSAGYKTIVWGTAAHHKKPLDIATLLATRYDAKALTISINFAPEMGGGGGACTLYIPSENLSVAGLHLAQHRTHPELLTRQYGDLELFVKGQKSIGRKVIVLGDFNTALEDMQRYGFAQQLRGTATPTFRDFWLPGCPNTRDIDHIFVDGKCEIKSAITYKGKSDHLFLVAEVE